MNQLAQLQTRRLFDVPPALSIVLGLVALAGVSSLVSFSGWVLDSPRLTDFGVEGNPMWPLSGIGFVFLAAGFWATYMWHRAAPVLLLVPLSLGLYFVFSEVVGLGRGLEGLVFGEQVARYAMKGAGRTAPTGIAAFLFLGTALLLVRHRTHAALEVANLLASASLCFGVFSLVPLLSALARHDPLTRMFVAPLPVDVAGLALSSAFLLWRQEAGWTLLQSASPAQRPIVNALLPLAFILPALPSFAARWGADPGMRAPVMTEMLAVLGNVAIIGLLIWIALARITRQGAALRDLTLALDSAAIALTDQDGVITHWSRGCQELYKWSSVQAVGRKKYELMRSRCEQAGSNAPPRAPLASGTELIERRRDGTEITILERRQLFVRANQEPLVVLRILDISQRVQAEAELRASETRLATAAEAHKLGVTEWDVASGRLTWTPGSEQRLGLPPGTMDTIESWQAVIMPEDGARMFADFESAAAAKAEYCAFRYRFRRADGQERSIEGAGRLFYGPMGDLITVVGANIDVTERNARDAALRSREAQLRSILETVPDAMIVLDEDGVIRTFSAAAEAMFGYPAATAVGRNARFLLPEPLASGGDGVVPEYLMDQSRFAAGAMRELTVQHADGREIPIELNVGETRIEGGRIFTVVARDVSDRHASERRLTDLGAELAHVARQSAMSELAADLAHELNQPLSATSNFLAAARMVVDSGRDTERVPELLRMGEEQMHRSGEIIRRLRDFLVKRDIEMHAESLNHMVREAVELVLFGAARNDIRVLYRLDPQVDMVFVDRIQVQQVMVNLLRNAIQVLLETAGDHDIIIASGPGEPGFVEVSVEDTGPGLPEGFADRFGTRFATTKSSESMGVGLSISRRIIEAHGGVLSAGKRTVGGAVFCFTIPLYEELVE